MTRMSAAVAQYSIPANSTVNLLVRLPRLPLRARQILVATDQDVSFNSDFYSPLWVREDKTTTDTESIDTARIYGSLDIKLNDPDFIELNDNLNFEVTNNSSATSKFLVMIVYIGSVM